MASKRVEITKPTRVAIYCRVATAAQIDDPAQEFQEQSLRHFAEAQGYEIAGVVKETGSGGTLDRPGIRQLYEMAGRRAMDAVLSKSISRYVRGPVQDFVGFIAAMESMGVTVATAQEGRLPPAGSTSSLWAAFFMPIFRDAERGCEKK